mgnify:CR=1 FL=1
MKTKLPSSPTINKSSANKQNQRTHDSSFQVGKNRSNDLSSFPDKRIYGKPNHTDSNQAKYTPDKAFRH